MKTIEEWISKVRAEYNLRECNENELSFEDDLQRATKIIEHLLRALNKYAALEGAYMPELQLWMDKGELAQEALAAAEKEIGG